LSNKNNESLKLGMTSKFLPENFIFIWKKMKGTVTPTQDWEVVTLNAKHKPKKNANAEQQANNARQKGMAVESVRSMINSSS